MSQIEPESNRIPAFLERFMCECSQPERVGYATLYPNHQHWIREMYALGMTIDQRMNRTTPIGQFCNICKKPIGYTVINAAKVCEGCEAYYVPGPKPETYPIQYFLCQKCDKPRSPSPFRRKAN